MIFVSHRIYPELLDKLHTIDQVVLIPETEHLYPGIKDHTDLHIHAIGQHLFISQEVYPAISEQLASSQCKLSIINDSLGLNYPDTALLNVISSPKYMICNESIVSKDLLSYARSMNLILYNVPQGYVRCTTLPITDTALITDDPGIEAGLKGSELQITLIGRGHIELKPYDYGFIGGTAGCIDGTVYFNGDIRDHPDYGQILSVCQQNNKSIYYIEDKPLVDIGGIINV